jgi:hypothetical protein
MRVELLWFQECPNHEDARHLLREVLRENGLPDSFDDIDATDPGKAEEVRFAGSPSIRINGVDVSQVSRSPAITLRPAGFTESQAGCRSRRHGNGSSLQSSRR